MKKKRNKIKNKTTFASRTLLRLKKDIRNGLDKLLKLVA